MSDLAQELLDAAREVAHRPARWLDRLADEHRQAVEAARDSWLKTGQASGISATRLAKVIVEKMTSLGYRTASWKQVQRWITTGKSD